MNEYYMPGKLEMFYGPMKSGKTKELFHRLDKISHMTGIDYAVIKPSTDVRDIELKSRYSNLTHPVLTVPWNEPYKIIGAIHNNVPNAKIVAIDEMQFFGEGIEHLVEFLLKQGRHVIGAGLNTNFRGEPMGKMGYLISIADKAYPLTGICDHKDCNEPSTRTQRLINGEPAVYDSPEVLVEGQGKETYETRCFRHHYVPRFAEADKQLSLGLEDRLK